MVDSNLQRENILPSEKAKAYKMKLEAIKRQAGRPGKNSAQVGQNFEGKTSRAQIAENSPDSSSQIQRYIRLNELEPELLQLVDEGKIGMTPAVEISYLTPDEQRLLIETIDSEQATPSFSQAQRMRRLSGEGKLNDDTILGIMLEQKKPENWNLTLPMEKIDELAVLDGGKCILQLRGVRPFMSNKFDITKHPNYKYLSDADPKNNFDIEKYLSTQLRTKPDDVYHVYEVDASDVSATA